VGTRTQIIEAAPDDAPELAAIHIAARWDAMSYLPAAAIRSRNPVKGCIHHSDRGSQYASETCRALLAAHGVVGSMSRQGNPYDNAKAESFIKTLKVEAVYLAAKRRSKTSQPTFHASSTRSTALDE
jgi:transposase InsO family protein